MSVKIRPYKKRRKKGWEVDISLRMPDGVVVRERIKAPVTSKSGAKYWGEQREQYLLKHGTNTPKSQEVLTFEQFAPVYLENHCRANQLKPSSIYAVESILRAHILPAFGSKRLSEISAADIAELKAGLNDRKPKTLNNVLAILSGLLRFAVDLESQSGLSKLPVKVKWMRVPRKAVEFYEPAEYELLVSAAEKIDPRLHAIILLGGDLGLREGEVLGLEWDSVQIGRRQLVVRRSLWRKRNGTPKSGRDRVLPMTTRTANALQRLRHLKGARVFYQDGGQPLTLKVLRRWISAAQQQSSLPSHGRFHLLRHTFCARLAMAGVPAKQIQELAGHTSLAVTERYVHLFRGSKEGAIKALETFDGRGDILETPDRASGNPLEDATLQ